MSYAPTDAVGQNVRYKVPSRRGKFGTSDVMVLEVIGNMKPHPACSITDRLSASVSTSMTWADASRKVT